MDDPWSNAWTDTAETTQKPAEEPPKRAKILDSPTWTTADDDAEIFTKPFGVGSVTAPPSWSLAGSSTEDSWDRQEVEALPPTLPSWSAPSGPLDEWSISQPSHDESLKIGVEDPLESTEQPIDTPADLPSTLSTLPESSDDSDDTPSNTPKIQPMTSDGLASPSQPSSPAHNTTTHFSVPPSPNVFGSFKSAIDIDETAHWSPPKLNDYAPPVEANSEEHWNSGWGSHDAHPDIGDVHSQQWGSSQIESSQSESIVASQYIDTLLAQWAELSIVMFDSGNSSGPEASGDDPNVALQELERLDRLKQAFVPDMALPQSVPFSSTAVSKNLQTSLKLSKNLPVTRGSPMSNLFVGRNSVAWETSVRNRVEPVVDDWAWMGGKPAEPEPEVKATPPPAKRSFLSLFGGRRTASIDNKTLGEAPSVPSTPPPPPTAEGIRKDSKQDHIHLDTTIANPTSITPESANQAVATQSPQSIPVIVNASRDNSTGLSELSTFPFAAPEPAEEAPSAVSRFLGRFARARPTSPSPSNHQMVLNSSELDFLDEIPSLNDGDDEMDAFEGMLSQKPVLQPSAFIPKLPAPLTPPPSAPRRQKFSLPPNSGAPQMNAVDDSWGTTTSVPIQAGIAPTPLRSTMSSGSKTLQLSHTPVMQPTSRSSTPVLPPPPASNRRSVSSLSTPPPQQVDGSFGTTARFPVLLQPPANRPSSVSTLNLKGVKPLDAENTASATLNGFDDFSDFVDGSPSSPAFPQSAVSTSSASSSRSKMLTPIITNTTPTSSTASAFPTILSMPPRNHVFDDPDGFGDFTSSEQNFLFPSPPPLPSPSPRLTAPLTPLHSATMQLPFKKPRSQATLMTKASQKTGVWPAPPSPLPVPLAPPPTSMHSKHGSSGSNGGDVIMDDLLGDSPTKRKDEPSLGYPFPILPSQNATGDMRDHSMLDLDLGRSALSPPPVALPSNQTYLPPPPFHANSIQPTIAAFLPPSSMSPATIHVPVLKPSGNSQESTGGKLSAQDLSFFEGL